MILFSDFDGTLHPRDDETEIFLANLQMVRKFRAAENQFCLATGRSLSSIKRAWPAYQDYLDGMLLDNGSVCINSDNEILFQYSMPKPLVDDIIAFINQIDPDGSRTQFVFYYDLSEHADATSPLIPISSKASTAALSCPLPPSTTTNCGNGSPSAIIRE